MKKLANFTILFFLFLTTNNANIFASENPIILHKLLMAHQVIATSTPSSHVNQQIAGSIVLINEKKYEVISFSFEDPTGSLTEETFEEYAKKQNLLGMKNSIVSPVKGISFEVFDSIDAHTEDGVYFYISLRLLDA